MQLLVHRLVSAYRCRLRFVRMQYTIQYSVLVDEQSSILTDTISQNLRVDTSRHGLFQCVQVSLRI